MGPVGAHVRISLGVWHIDRVHFNELIYGEKGAILSVSIALCPLLILLFPYLVEPISLILR